MNTLNFFCIILLVFLDKLAEVGLLNVNVGVEYIMTIYYIILDHGVLSSVFWRPSRTAYLNPGNARAKRNP